MKPNQIYRWQMETRDGSVTNQFDEQGNEQSWKKLKPEDVVRVSFIPVIQLLPRHDVFIDISDGERFIKRFGRGILKNKKDAGWQEAEYINCCETNRYRFWVLSNGRTMVTKRNFEVYI